MSEYNEIKPVPVEPYQDGYQPKYAYRTLDCHIWHDTSFPRSKRWRLRVQRGAGDTFSNHPTLRAARITASIKLGVRP